MSRAKRVIIMLIVIELVLAGVWLYLAHLAATSAGANPEAPVVIGRTMGGVMGLVLGLSPLLYLLARSNDRKEGVKKGE